MGAPLPQSVDPLPSIVPFGLSCPLEPEDVVFQRPAQALSPRECSGHEASRPGIDPADLHDLGRAVRIMTNMWVHVASDVTPPRSECSLRIPLRASSLPIPQ